jgi:quercetin dioxygenase-like cupin family protein
MSTRSPDSTSEYGSTSGSDTRESRPLMERLMVFDLHSEIDSLRREAQWTDGDRNSRTLAKEVDFRVLLSVLREGATLDEQDGDARVSLQVIAGAAELLTDAGSTELRAGQLAAVDAGQRWQLRASEDSAVLLTLAWPREKASV